MAKKKPYEEYLDDDLLKKLDGDDGLPEVEEVIETDIPPIDEVMRRIDADEPILNEAAAEEDIPEFLKDRAERRAAAPFGDEGTIAAMAEEFVVADEEKKLGETQAVKAQPMPIPPSRMEEYAHLKHDATEETPAPKKMSLRNVAIGVFLVIIASIALFNLFGGDSSPVEPASTEETLNLAGVSEQAAQEAQPTEGLNLAGGGTAANDEPAANNSSTILVSLSYPCPAGWDVTYADPDYSMDRYNCMAIQFLNWLHPGAVTPTNWVLYLQGEEEFKALYLKYLKGNNLSTLGVTQEMLNAIGIQQ